jgi:hypothetical protein
MNTMPDPAPPPAPRPVRWDEALIASYLYELERGTDDGG